jgi:hypothetical protein
MKTIALSDKQVIPFTTTEIEEQQQRLGRRCGISDGDLFQPPLTTHVVHSGLLDYLALAYAHHYSVVLRPDDIWFTVMAEVAQAVAKKPEAYASLFTTTPGAKQEIVVVTADVTQISPESVLGLLKRQVPTNVDLFVPAPFSTTTPDARLALYIAFCDIVSPYYDYATMLCGIPALRLDGTEEDWARVVDGLGVLSELFKPLNAKVQMYLGRCLSCVKAMVAAVVLDDVANLNRLVKIERCGSGHQFKMNGWILDLLLSTKQGTQLEGLPPQLACMSYTNLDTGRKFKMFTGLTESVLDGNFLVPRYGRYVVEIKPAAQKSRRSLEIKLVTEQLNKSHD